MSAWRPKWWDEWEPGVTKLEAVAGAVVLLGVLTVVSFLAIGVLTSGAGLGLGYSRQPGDHFIQVIPQVVERMMQDPSVVVVSVESAGAWSGGTVYVEYYVAGASLED